jgi:hypothetical protein
LLEYIGVTKSQGGRPRAVAGPTRDDRKTLDKVKTKAAELNLRLGRNPNISEVAVEIDEFAICQKSSRLLAGFLKSFAKKELRKNGRDSDRNINLAYNKLLKNIHIDKTDKGRKKNRTDKISDTRIELAITSFTAEFFLNHNEPPSLSLIAHSISPFKDNKNPPASFSSWVTKRIKKTRETRKSYLYGLGAKSHSQVKKKLLSPIASSSPLNKSGRYRYSDSEKILLFTPRLPE